MISTQATTGDESTAMASNEEIADDAALAGQADAFSIGDAIRWLKLGQQRRSSGDVREQAEASAMLESATQGGYMFYNSFGGVACCVEIKLSRRVLNHDLTPSTRRLLDSMVVLVPHHSTEPGRPRHRRKMT